MEILLDLEYTIKLMANTRNPQRYAQQAPSGDLRHMAEETELKAHNDKPFYVAVSRLAVVNGGDDGQTILDALSSLWNLYQFGGRPLNVVSHRDYRSILPEERIQEIFPMGVSYRPGFLLNSWELTGLVHFPLLTNVERDLPLMTLNSLSTREPKLTEGTRIGISPYAGEQRRVCIPEKTRLAHTHIVGRPGVGKSSVMEAMILEDISRNNGVAVLDPHGDLVERLLGLIPQEAIHRTIYFDPGDPDWVPLWNPLAPIPGQDVARTADDLVCAIKSVMSGWGDRLEHLLRHALFALMELPGSTLFDVSNLLQAKSEASDQLRKKFLHVIENATSRHFWQHDFDRYGKDDFGPPKHKLSKLLLSGTVSLMLSQPENRFSIRDIMNDGYILLMNLSTIGSEIREILGSFLLSLMHLNALSRRDMPIENRKSFFVYTDEAHRFVGDAMEDMIAETRKFGVGLTFAHQYLDQFRSRTNTITSVASSIIFNVDKKDAYFLAKDLQDRVTVADLTSLDIGEAIARIGTEIVRIETPKPLQIPTRNYREQIIDQSHRRYCKPVQDIQQSIHERYHLTQADIQSPFTSEKNSDLTPNQNERPLYDELSLPGKSSKDHPGTP